MSDKQLQKEIKAMEAVQTKMRQLLSDIAYVVKGPNDKDWGDLPDRVHRLVVEHRHLKDWWARHMQEVADGYAQVAVDLGAVRAEATAAGFQMGVRATLERLEGHVRPTLELTE